MYIGALGLTLFGNLFKNAMLQERVANLLGVAGTDIPIEYIQRLMLPYRVRLAPLLKTLI